MRQNRDCLFIFDSFLQVRLDSFYYRVEIGRDI